MMFGAEQEFAQTHARRHGALLWALDLHLPKWKFEPAYVYAPYVPLYITPVFDLNATARGILKDT